jgi:hypothetical protein
VRGDHAAAAAAIERVVSHADAAFGDAGAGFGESRLRACYRQARTLRREHGQESEAAELDQRLQRVVTNRG